MTANKKQSYNALIRLACGNELWLPKPRPHLGEHLWCPRCRNYCEVGPGEALAGTVLYPDYEWTSKPHAVRGWVGYCNVPECGYSRHEKAKWYDLKAHMETHYLREHSGSSLLSNMTVVDTPAVLPRNSPAPF